MNQDTKGYSKAYNLSIYLCFFLFLTFSDKTLFIFQLQTFELPSFNFSMQSPNEIFALWRRQDLQLWARILLPNRLSRPWKPWKILDRRKEGLKLKVAMWPFQRVNRLHLTFFKLFTKKKLFGHFMPIY